MQQFGLWNWLDFSAARVSLFSPAPPPGRVWATSTNRILLFFAKNHVISNLPSISGVSFSESCGFFSLPPVVCAQPSP